MGCCASSTKRSGLTHKNYIKFFFQISVAFSERCDEYIISDLDIIDIGHQRMNDKQKLINNLNIANRRLEKSNERNKKH